ncbi:MAG: hypothetical protein M3P43_01980 [Actinomycetota bacterium]|nr:hypothetical protein [Actinomycetota bacterium]
MSATWEEFERLRITIGLITEVEDFPQARVPAYKLTIDLGPEIGTKRLSAQLTHYAKEDMLGRQVVCVLGFEPKRIAGFPPHPTSRAARAGARSAVRAGVVRRGARTPARGSAAR